MVSRARVPSGGANRPAKSAATAAPCTMLGSHGPTATSVGTKVSAPSGLNNASAMGGDPTTSMDFDVDVRLWSRASTIRRDGRRRHGDG